MCSQKFREKKNHLFLETKMTKYVLQIYVYTTTFYGFHMLSKFVQSQSLRSDTSAHWLLMVLWQCMNCLMLGQTIYQAFISNRWPSESFPRSLWVKKFNLQITFMYIHFSHYANPPKCIIDTADLKKTLDVFNIYFFGQWFVKIKLKKLSILTCEFVSNFVARYWYKMVATPCFRHGLWLCKAIPHVSTNIDHFFLTYTEKMWWKEFLLHIDQALIDSSKIWSCRDLCKLRFAT